MVMDYISITDFHGKSYESWRKRFLGKPEVEPSLNSMPAAHDKN